MIAFILEKPQKLSKSAFNNVDGLTYGAFMKLLRKKDIKVNGVRVCTDVALKVGDRVEIYYTAVVNAYSVVYVDDNVVLIDKKSGYESDKTFELLKKDYPTARFIHRLDRNTSGLMIFALNDRAETELLRGFKIRAFDKKYLCTVNGRVEKDGDVLTAYLVKDSDNSLVKIFDKKVEGSVEIKTGYKVLSRNENTTELEVTLFTGKTHQIRAHLAHIGHFIIGDGKYGDNAINKLRRAKRQMLKAYKLTLKFDADDLLYYLNDKTFEI